ncbi:type-2 ice-structuring protein-like isoform X1 [Lates japonicus]
MLIPVKKRSSVAPQEVTLVIIIFNICIISTMRMLTVTLLFCAMTGLTITNGNPINAPAKELSLNTTLGKFTVSISISTNCPSGWTPFNGHCLRFVSSELSWAKSQQNCQSMNANLASVHSIEEYHTIQRMIRQNSLFSRDVKAWIGGSDCQEENAWFWIDGTPFLFTNWCDREPDNRYSKQHCIQINYGDGKCWSDADCSSLRPSVCAKTAS